LTDQIATITEAMIISHAHRFVFVKTNKTAGSSMEALLESYLQPGDMMTKRGEIKFDKNYIKALKNRGIEALSKRKHNIVSHSPLIAAYEKFPESRNYFSFGVLRNPFQRYISSFRWNKGRKIKRLLEKNPDPEKLEQKLRILFLIYIQEGNSHLNTRGRNLLQSVSSDGHTWCVDRIYRLEALSKLEKDLAAATGLKIDHEAMPHLKSDIVAIPKKVNLFTSEAIQLITSQHHWELDALGYIAPPAADGTTDMYQKKA
jgi:hypothetical protein